jgi:ADP-dependent NAD(P)H-hydrate dehydratase
MSGAPCLAALGALRAGAGLVFLVVPDCIQSIAASFNPCYMTLGLPSSKDGAFDGTSIDDANFSTTNYDAVAIGPGMRVTESTTSFVADIYAKSAQPIVVDADALNALSTESQSDSTIWSRHAGPRIVTPHPGEFARMTGLAIREVEDSREDIAAQFAREHSVIVVLKGPGTITTDGKKTVVNTTGNPGMATGGSGDVLTGVIAALVGQGLELFAAAQLGVWLHGRAGDLAALDFSEPGLIASDLPKYIAKAWKELSDAPAN